MKKNLLVVGSVICFVCFLVLAILVTMGSTTPFDTFVYQGIQTIRIPEFWKFITRLGSFEVIVLFLVFIAIFWRQKRNSLFLILCMVMEAALNFGLKFIFQRPRPSVLHLVEESGYSFPSGHAMTITTFGLLLIFFLWQSKLSKSKKILGSIFLGLLILLVCLSRVYLGVHYASDILAGFLLGSAFSLFCCYFYLHQKKLS